MPLVLDGRLYYTTKEAANYLGLDHATVRGAVMRGRIAARRLGELRRNVIAFDDLERYKADVSGQKGWEMRKAPGYSPNVERREYQRAWREQHRQKAVPIVVEAPRAGR